MRRKSQKILFSLKAQKATQNGAFYGISSHRKDLQKVIKILFVCHGNICRSPMAEFIMKDMVAKEGLADSFEIASAAVSSEEQGNPVSTSSQRMLRKLGLSCAGKTARKMTKRDYDYYDLIICMDESNLFRMSHISGGDPQGKYHKLLDYTARGGNVADPWYTGDYETACADILEGCAALLETLK